MTGPKFPHIEVPLIGESGDAFAIIGRVRRAMRRGGCTKEQIAEFSAEAMSGDYDHLLRTVLATVSEGEEV